MEFNLSIVGFPESGKLDFKESYGFMCKKPLDVEDKEWKKYVEGQWDEFCKDAIALSNGDLSSSASPAIIVIGVRETGDTKEIIGIEGLDISRETMLKKLNASCSPTITDVILHFAGEEKKICIIEIPYTSKLIESSKTLKIYSIATREGKKTAIEKNSYSKYCVFYRVGDTTEIASLDVIAFLSYIKSGAARFKVERLIEELERNLQLILHETKKGQIFDPIQTYDVMRGKVEFKLDGNTRIRADYIKWMFISALSGRDYCNNNNYYVLDNIFNDAEFCNYIRNNYEYSEVFFDSIIHLRRRSEHLMRNQNGLSEAIAELVYDLPRGDKSEVIVDSKKLLTLATCFVRIYDIVVLHIGLISYLKKNYHYILSRPISPFYVAKTEEDKSDIASLGAVRKFIEQESSR